jgi:hypothetical protein
MDLYLELDAKIKALDVSIKNLRKSGTDLAQAEKDYKIALRTEILKLRDENVAVGVIDKICYGIPSIADLRFKRDVAKTIYVANLEAINTYKLEIRIIQNQIDKEMSNG